MATDVIIDPSTGQIYWNDSAGVGTESISIKGDAVNTISFTGYSGSFSPGSTPAGALTLVTIKDSAGTDALIPGTSGYNLGSATLRWNTFATNANLSGTLVVSDTTISSSLLTGSTRINGGIAISGNASIGQSLNFYNTAATFYTGFKAGTISANTLYTLPTAFPGSASLLQSDASGTLTWVGSIGTATTATNINVVAASTSASHPVLFTPASGTASGAALSTESTFVYNPSTDILSVSGLAITSGTASTSSTTGALTVSGGVGIGGSLNVGIAVTTFGVPRIASFVGSNNGSSTVVIQNTSTSDSMYAQIQFLDYSGSYGFIRKNSTNNSSFAGAMNLYNVGDIVIQAATGYTVNIYSVVKVIPGTASISTSSGALIVSGGVGIGGSIFGGSTISAADNIEIKSGKELRLNNTGNTFYTGLKAGANASNTTYTFPVAFPGTGTSVLQSDTSGTLTWVAMASGSGSGLATTATNVQVNIIGNPNSFHPLLMTPVQSSAGSAVSANGTLLYNPSTDILYTPGLAVTSGVDATNTTSGALQVRGGIGATGTSYFQTISVASLTGTGNAVINGNFTFNGVGVFGNATTDTINSLARYISDILPSADNSYDLGNNALGWRNFRVSGVGTVVTLSVTSSTVSTSTTTGALVVTGGVGISGRLTFNQASFGTTGIASNPTMAMIGQTGDPIYMSVLEDNSISFEGSQGQLFSISPNLTTGYIWSVNDISGVPFLRSSVGGTIGIAEFGGVVGIGQTNPLYKLDLKGNFGLASSGDGSYSFIFSNSAATGSNSLQVRSANSILLYNSGNTFYTGLKSNAAANVTYTLPTTDGSSGQFLQTNGTGALTWATATGSGGTGSSVGVGQGGQYEMAYYPGTGLSVVGSNTFTNNTVTGVVSITHATVSTDFSNGAFKVTGGVGIGGSLYVGGIGASIVGVTFSNSSITRGTWNGTAISPTYGGTGLNNSSATGLLQYSSGTASVITTSSALASIISDETGTAGKLVFSTSPVFTTSVTTDSGSFSVFNTTATTINAFGAATTLSVGAATGKATFNSTDDSSSTTTGTLAISGGAGFAKSVSIGGRLQMFNGGNFTAFVSSATGNTVYTLPATSPATGSSVLQSTSAGVMSWVPMVASSGSGLATTATNVNVNTLGNPNSFHPLLLTPAQSSAGSAVSANVTLVYNPSTDILNTPGLAVTSGVNATNTTSGAFQVRGGIGITGNAFIGGTINVASTSVSNIANVSFTNGIITSGSWSGSTITAFYGGTGLQGPTAIGDLIVANSATTWSRYATSATSGQVLTSNGTGSAPTWQAVPASAASSVAVAPTVVNAQFFIPVVNAASSAGLGLSSVASLVINPSTGLVSLSGLAVTNTTASINASSGTLIVTGGAAVGQTLSVGGSLNVFNGANYSGFRYSGSANTTYTLPTNSPQSAVGTSVLTSTTAGVMSWIGMSSGGSGSPGGSNKQIQYNNATAFGGASGFEYTTGGIAVTVSVFSPSGIGYTSGLWVSAIGGTTRVGIGLSNPQFELEILGELSATNKSFVIDHPTKSGMKLRYGSLEGPENGVYVRGELKGTNIIEVPDHWVGLVHEDSYTVHLTPIGKHTQLYVEKIENYNVFVAENNNSYIHCYYSVWAERKDIPKLVTEYEAQ